MADAANKSDAATTSPAEKVEEQQQSTPGTTEPEQKDPASIPRESKGEERDEDEDAASSIKSSSSSAHVAPANEKVSEEAVSRKRDREGSIDPSSTTAPAPAAPAGRKHVAPRSSDAPIPAKKNRIIDDEESSESAQEPGTETEKEKVGQIRRRVEELSYEERESKRADTGASKETDETTATASNVPPELPPRTAPLPSSSATAKQDPPIAASTSNAATPARKQPTFSSFSSSSSPFASSSASAGVSGPSWLAGSSSSSSSSPSESSSIFGNGVQRSGGISGSTGAIKPSSLGGGAPAASKAAESNSTSSNKATTSVKVPSATPANKSSAGLGFGAFAGSRPFTKTTPAGTPAADTPSPAASTPLSTNSGDAKDAADASRADAGGVQESVFDKQLKDGSSVETHPSGDADRYDSQDVEEVEGGKVKVQKKDDSELATGEENERTIHSVRAKLYAIMKGEGENATSAADGAWKERGTGTVRLNIPKSSSSSYGSSSSKSGARLVMRAEGVLRLILNVALFSGMKVELAQDKFVRFVAIENEDQLVHFALKVSNPVAANALYQAITSSIPDKQKGKSNSIQGDEIA
ncbi:unnamed protein product [Sympodiomycopsis kandeliae]